MQISARKKIVIGVALVFAGLLLFVFPRRDGAVYYVQQIQHADQEQWLDEQRQQFHVDTSEIPENDEAAEEAVQATASNGVGQSSSRIPYARALVVPRLRLVQPIREGDSLDVLDSQYGVWRDNRSEDHPDKGNIVIAGHRLRYSWLNSSTFYHIDKIQEGDDIHLFWDGREYIYTVTQLEEVQPDAVDVLRNSGTQELTLYTCSPLGDNARRFIMHTQLYGTRDI